MSREARAAYLSDKVEPAGADEVAGCVDNEPPAPPGCRTAGEKKGE